MEGHIDLANGERLNLDSEKIIQAPEQALAFLGAAIVVLGAGLLTFRLQTQ